MQVAASFPAVSRASRDPAPSRAWEVTAIDALGRRTVTRCNAPDSFAAVASVMDAAKHGAAPHRKVSARPLIEVTEIEGAARHPLALHPAASCLAQMGWDRSERRALAADLANAQRDPWARHDRQALIDQQRVEDAMGCIK